MSISVGGMHSKVIMEEVLNSGDTDFIALSRPLLNDPNFPNLIKSGKQEISTCISVSNCRVENVGEGIACKRPVPNAKS